MSNKAYIQTDDLVKVYRLGNVEVQALRGLSMQVHQGEMVAIVGASGSGKTTLLNILGGITKATAGNTVVAGYDVTNASAVQLVALRREIVGHIFQELNLIPTLTAYENVELPMLAARVDAHRLTIHRACASYGLQALRQQAIPRLVLFFCAHQLWLQA